MDDSPAVTLPVADEPKILPPFCPTRPPTRLMRVAGVRTLSPTATLADETELVIWPTLRPTNPPAQMSTNVLPLTVPPSTVTLMTVPSLLPANAPMFLLFEAADTVTLRSVRSLTVPLLLIEPNRPPSE